MTSEQIARQWPSLGLGCSGRRGLLDTLRTQQKCILIQLLKAHSGYLWSVQEETDVQRLEVQQIESSHRNQSPIIVDEPGWWSVQLHIVQIQQDSEC